MNKNIIILVILILISISLWSTQSYFNEFDVETLLETFTVITISFAFFKIFLGQIVYERVKNKKSRYVLRKTISTLFFALTSLYVLRLWINDIGILVAVYGFIAAAVAFAVQDFFKNFLGGMVVLVKGLYKVGDRVSINGVVGDVIDIDLLYTELLEIQNWVSGDQPTGRIVSVPNSKILLENSFNYTQDHSFIWDEVHVPIPYAGDWRGAVSIIESVIKSQTHDIEEVANKEITKLQDKYFISNTNISSKTFLKLTDNWISIYGRYACLAKERRTLNSDIMINILEEFEKAGIEVASTTLEVSQK